MRILFFAIAFAALAAAADDADDWKRQLEEERKAREADRQEFERRLAALESQKNAQLRHDVEEYLEEKDLFAGEKPEATRAGLGSLIDISVILDVTAGGSTADDEALGQINLGDHDPKVRGFNVRNEELVISADVDPYFYGFLDIVYKISEDGDSEFELEEAYGLTTSLPANLQFKVGQFFTEFGRANPTHPHAWEFLNSPVIIARVLGPDGWRGQGARLSWIAPAPFPLTVLVGAQNAKGETQVSFLGEEGETIGDYTLESRSFAGLSDLAWNARVEASHDLAAWRGTLTALLGFSFGCGPNGTGPDANTTLYGTDLYLKWRPERTEAGWPFVAWQTEFLWRDYEAAAQATPLVLPGTTYEDWGFYTQVVWAFRRPWTAGVRYDYADSDGVYPGTAQRLSLAVTYYTSEFGRIRLQLNWDSVAGLDTLVPGASDHAFSVWINFDFSLGKHGAHKF
ncbi:MAG TPA: hypothetical protein VFY93_05965 [Planctomycetota bacterium]|nr:hypothetical protein [Planctomycetota bacterium]